MEIRKAAEADLDEILEIYSQARRFMAKNGNPSQWGDVYPPRKLVEADIAEGKRSDIRSDQRWAVAQ